MAVTIVNPTKCTTPGPLTASDDTVLVAPLTVLTTSFSPTGANGNCARALGWRSCVFKGPYVKGGETLFELRPEGSADNGVTWYPLSYKDVQAAGLSPLTKDVISLTPASYAASDTWSLPPMDCTGWPLVRICGLGTGSPTGTWGASVSFGDPCRR